MKTLKGTLEKTHTLHWKEKTSGGRIEKSCTVPKEQLEFHLKEISKSPDVLYDVFVTQ